MKKAVASVVAGMGILILPACGPSAEPSVPSHSQKVIEFQKKLPEYVVEFQKKLSDGRTVTCLIEDVGNFREGISCDWESAK